MILAGSADCGVWMWNADSGAYLNMFSGHGASVTCGDFTPDGNSFSPLSEMCVFLFCPPLFCFHSITARKI